jgi:anti-anti-sigma factor
MCRGVPVVDPETAPPGRTADRRRAGVAPRTGRPRRRYELHEYRPSARVTTEPVSGDVVVIVVDGEFDIGSTNLIADAVTIVLDRGHRQLVVDLQGTTFLDCSSLSALLAAVAPLHHDPEAAVVLAGAGGIVARLLDLVGARRHVPVAASRGEALEALRDLRLGNLAAPA